MSTQVSLHSGAPWLGMAFAALVAVIAFTLGTGLTDAYGTNSVIKAKIGAWSDGAAPDTFWDSPVVDLPGLSVFWVHCHGRVNFDLQYGATGPNHRNTCIAAMNAVNTGGLAAVDAYVFFPIGNKVLYRCNMNDAPWIYYVGDIIPAPDLAQPTDPAVLSQGHCRLP
jgi:hypothetical protein